MLSACRCTAFEWQERSADGYRLAASRDRISAMNWISAKKNGNKGRCALRRPAFLRKRDPCVLEIEKESLNTAHAPPLRADRFWRAGARKPEKKRGMDGKHFPGILRAHFTSGPVCFEETTKEPEGNCSTVLDFLRETCYTFCICIFLSPVRARARTVPASRKESGFDAKRRHPCAPTPSPAPAQPETRKTGGRLCRGQ